MFLKDRVEEKEGEITLIDAHSFLWTFHLIQDTPLLKEPIHDAKEPTHISQKPTNGSSPNRESRVTIGGGKEGKRTEHYVTRYERNSALRSQAIEIHGYACAACGMQFEHVYGPLGKEFIEVHHLKPLSTYEEEAVVDPQTDMVCLCSNCHSMIHRKKNAIVTVEELRQAIAQRREAESSDK